MTGTSHADTTATPPQPREGTQWAGTPASRARAWLAARTDWPTPCARCGLPVTPDRWHLGHHHDRQAYAHLTWDPDNWQVEHIRCSQSAGARQGNARRRKLRAVPIGDEVFSPESPGGPLRRGTVSDPVRTVPVVLSDEPRLPGDRDGLPRMFPDPHPSAVGSLGDEFVRFVEGSTGTRLRWWQWVTAQRRYEVDADGRWCWPRVWTSVPRQQGKSVELSRDGAWHGGLGRAALTLHAAYRVTTSRDVQAELWSWAVDSGLPVAKQLGDSRITWPDGSVWKTLAMESAYSQRPRRLLVDEAWAMHPAPFWNALWPALSGQDETVQALFWSCANPDDRGLAADLRGDVEVCRMEWGAGALEDPADPAVWRAATAYWNPGREALMRPAVGKPGFAENWLNVWPERGEADRWVPLSLSARAAGRVGDAPGEALCAIESTPDGARWAVAAVWPHTRSRVRGRVWLLDSLAACVRVVGERRVWVHDAVRRRPELGRRAGVVAVSSGDARAATVTLRDSVVSGLVLVAGLPDDQWAAARTIPADGGEVLSAGRSAGDVHGLKALSWAVWALQSERDHSGSLVL